MSADLARVTQAFLDELVSAIADAVAERLAKRGPATVNAKALTRRQAERALGVGRTKLQELIAAGELKTVKDNPRLVPASEVERYCQPRRQKPRRRVAPRTPPAGTQNPDALRDALRRSR